MKNFIKVIPVILFVCSPFLAFSQLEEVAVEKKDEIDIRIDNVGYWLEKAELGLVGLNPELPPLPVIHYDGRSGGVDGTDILIVTGRGISQSENSVFVNPIDNQICLNGNNSFLGTLTSPGANAMFTFDGGATWTGGPNAPLTDNYGDPAMAVNLDGISFAGHIDNGFGQSVNISPDDGATWTSSVVDAGGILDKNHLWVDNSIDSKFSGNLYSSWTQFYGGAGDSEISFSSSTDDGVTWSEPFTISDGVSAGNVNQGVNIQTGPLGEVYVTWAIYDGSVNSGEDAIGFCMSTDGGVTFSTAVRIQTNIQGIRGLALTNPTGKNQRTNSFPVMACDISSGGNRGDLYVVWTNVGVPGINTGSDVSIYMIRSTDGGTTWGTATRVNQDPVGNIQYLPWIASDPVTGNLHTIFYDDRELKDPAMVETWVASSPDGGVTWTEFRVSDVAFTPAPIPDMTIGYMGDYLGIAARDCQVYPVWTDNRTGQTLSYTSPFTCKCECVDHLVITTDVPGGSVDHQEADLTITASNVIFPTGEAIYHAGDEVLMVTGFLALQESEYHAYIEPCSGIFILAPTDVDEDGVPVSNYVKSPKPKMLDFYDENPASIELSVFPNPTNDVFSLQLNNDEIINNFTVKIYSMSMGLVFVQEFTDRNTNLFQIDISEFNSGVYFIELIDTENNKLYNGKVIKK